MTLLNKFLIGAGLTGFLMSAGINEWGNYEHGRLPENVKRTYQIESTLSDIKASQLLDPQKKRHLEELTKEYSDLIESPDVQAGRKYDNSLHLKHYLAALGILLSSIPLGIGMYRTRKWK